MNLIGGDERMVNILMDRRAHISRTGKQLSNNNKGKNNANNAQRISNRTTQRGACRRQAELRQGFLGGAERGSIGRCAGKDADHVAHRNVEADGEADGYESAYDHCCQPEQVELHAAGAERRKEAGADLQTELINKENEAEILGIEQHLRVNRQAEMAGKNTDEKHERYSQRHTPDLDFA